MERPSVSHHEVDRRGKKDYRWRKQLEREMAEAPTHPAPWGGTYKEWVEEFLDLEWGVPPHQEALAEQCIRSPVSENFVDLEPRGHGKSTTISFALLMFILCESTCHTLNPYLEGWLDGPNDVRIMHVSCSINKDKRYIKHLKRELADNARIHAHYGKILEPPGSTFEFNLKGRKNRKEPSMAGAGIGQDIVGWHGSLLVLDDVIQDDKPKDESVRLKKQDWADETLEGCVRPRTKVWWVGTRKSPQDIYQFIMDKPGTEVRLQVAIREERCPFCWELMEGGMYNQHLKWMVCSQCQKIIPLDQVRADVLWPEERPYEWLVKKRAKMGSFKFSREYQNKPITEEGSLMKKSWLTFYDELPFPRTAALAYGGVDPALGESETADYTVMATLFVYDNEIWLDDGARGRWNFLKTKEFVKQHWKRVGHAQVGMEAQFYQRALSQELIDTTLIPIVEVKHLTDKVQRIMSTIAVYAEQGKFHVNRNLPFLDAFLEEYLDFPNARHDDTLDAVATALEVAKHPVGAVLFV